jgi:hypothetical protein
VLPGKSEKDESKCGRENIDRLLVFSNNYRMKLEFDSKTSDTNFDKVIERSYKSTNVVGGRRPRTQKRRRFHKRINTKKMRKSIKIKCIRKHPKI